MNVGRLYITVILFLLAILAYSFHIFLRPSFTIISLTLDQSIPTYTHDTTTRLFDTYIPQGSSKILTRLTLTNLFRNESIYKIIIPQAFNPSQIDNCVQLSQADKQDNFIHAALGSQIPHILEKFFKEAPTVLALELDQEALKNAGITVRKEQNKVDGTYFPHLYGMQKIPVSCIKTVFELAKKETEWVVHTISIVVPNNAK